MPGLLVLFLVVDAFLDATENLALVHVLRRKAEVVLHEVDIDEGTRDAHSGSSDREIALALHHSNGEASLCEAENLLGDVGGNLRRLVAVLHLVTVDAVGGHSALRIAREHTREIDGAGTLSAVETPNGLRDRRVDVHRLGAVAPARRDGKRDANVVRGELVRALRGLKPAADRRICDDTFDRRAVGILEVVGDQLRGGFRHRHCLVFERLPNAAPAAVDDWANAHLGERIVCEYCLVHRCWCLC